jgi:hypothetical protein
MNEPPDHTALFSAEFVVGRGDHRGEVPLDQFGILAKRGVHIAENHALRLEIFAIAVEHHFGFILRSDTGQVLLLCLRNTELLVGQAHRFGERVPRVDLTFHRLDVVVDVVEEDLGHVATPAGHGLAEEHVERPKTEFAHPVGLALHPRHFLDDVSREAALGREHIAVDVVGPAQFVLAEIEIRDGGAHRGTPWWMCRKQFPLPP